MKTAFLLVFFILLSPIQAKFSDTFVVRFYDRKVQVIGPQKRPPEMSIIIENHTLSDLYGRIESEDGVHHHLVIRAGKDGSYPIKSLAKGLSFLPLSPPFQKIKLVEGKDSYEIP